MQVTALSDGGTNIGLVQLGARTTRETSREVVTADGDRVTLSTSSTRALGYAAASGVSDTAQVSASALTVTGSDSVSLTVEGSLSHDELVDLQKVVKAFEKAAARGDATKLLDRLSRPDLDTIASVSGTASTQSQVSATVLSA
jgi:hypothetical protein